MFTKINRKKPFNDGYPGQMMQWSPYDPRFHQENRRSQPFFPPQAQNINWQPFQNQNPYYPQQYQPVNQHYQQGFAENTYPYQQPSYPSKDAQFLFQNPLQPQEEYYPNTYPTNNYSNPNPYPKQNFLPKQPGGMQSLINSFKSQDGSVDFNKMMNTAGQMMTAVNQVSSLVKGLGGIFKV